MSWANFLYCHISYLSGFAPDVRLFSHLRVGNLRSLQASKNPGPALSALLGLCLGIVVLFSGAKAGSPRYPKISRIGHTWWWLTMTEYLRFKLKDNSLNVWFWVVKILKCPQVAAAAGATRHGENMFVRIRIWSWQYVGEGVSTRQIWWEGWNPWTEIASIARKGWRGKPPLRLQGGWASERKIVGKQMLIPSGTAIPAILHYTP